MLKRVVRIGRRARAEQQLRLFQIGRQARRDRAECRAGQQPGAQTSLGNALIWAKGHHAPETTAAFARALEFSIG